MKIISFVWDGTKAESNLKKHKISFKEAQTIFSDPNARMVFDPEQGGTAYLFNLANDPMELENLAGVAGYEEVSADLTSQLLSHYISLNQFTHYKEQMRLQKVRVKYNN